MTNLKLSNMAVVHYAAQILDTRQALTIDDVALGAGITPDEFSRWIQQRECPGLRQMILACAAQLHIQRVSDLLVVDIEDDQIIIHNRIDALLAERRPRWSRVETMRRFRVGHNTLYRWLNHREHVVCYATIAALMRYFGISNIDELYTLNGL